MDPFIAQIMMFGGNFSPRGWALCNGQLLPIAQNQALFSILGTTYGGDGRTTFGLPDMRGRVPMHPGNGPGLTQRRLGAKGGVEEVTLNTAQIPSHEHPVNTEVACSNAAGTADSPEARVWAGSSEGDQVYAASGNKKMGDAVSVDVQPSGGGQAHTNVQPFICVNYIIALQGIFPSRN